MGNRSKERIVAEGMIRKHFETKDSIGYETLTQIFIQAGLSPESVVSVVSTWQFRKEFGVVRERNGGRVIFRKKS